MFLAGMDVEVRSDRRGVEDVGMEKPEGKYVELARRAREILAAECSYVFQQGRAGDLRSSRIALHGAPGARESVPGGDISSIFVVFLYHSVE